MKNVSKKDIYSHPEFIELDRLLTRPSAEEFIVNAMNGCVIHKNEKLPNSVFYIKDGKVLFETRDNTFNVSFHYIFEILRNEYELSDEDIKQMIKNVIKKTYNLTGFKVECYPVLYYAWVEKFLNENNNA